MTRCWLEGGTVMTPSCDPYGDDGAGRWAGGSRGGRWRAVTAALVAVVMTSCYGLCCAAVTGHGRLVTSLITCSV